MFDYVSSLWSISFDCWCSNVVLFNRRSFAAFSLQQLTIFLEQEFDDEREKREHALMLISLLCSLFDLSSSFLTRRERRSHLDRIFFSFALLSFSHIELIVDSLFTYTTCSAGTFPLLLLLLLSLSRCPICQYVGWARSEQNIKYLESYTYSSSSAKEAKRFLLTFPAQLILLTRRRAPALDRSEIMADFNEDLCT